MLLCIASLDVRDETQPRAQNAHHPRRCREWTWRSSGFSDCCTSRSCKWTGLKHVFCGYHIKKMTTSFQVKLFNLPNKPILFTEPVTLFSYPVCKNVCRQLIVMKFTLSKRQKMTCDCCCTNRLHFRWSHECLVRHPGVRYISAPAAAR